MNLAKQDITAQFTKHTCNCCGAIHTEATHYAINALGLWLDCQCKSTLLVPVNKINYGGANEIIASTIYRAIDLEIKKRQVPKLTYIKGGL